MIIIKCVVSVSMTSLQFVTELELLSLVWERGRFVMYQNGLVSRGGSRMYMWSTRIPKLQ